MRATPLSTLVTKGAALAALLWLGAAAVACKGDDDAAPASPAAADDGGGASGDASADGEPALDAAPDACPAGSVGCACGDGGACGSGGRCEQGTCVACDEGTAACACRAGAACDPGLRCQGGSCAVCVAGVAGCACRLDGSCDGGLACVSGLCTDVTCPAGGEGCACRAAGADAGPPCDGTARCGGDALCHACASDAVGCPCGGACAGDLVCAAGLCRAAQSCADLRAAGTCVAHGACVEGSGGHDASCTPGACEPGWRWDAAGGACVACGDGGCVAAPSCLPGAAGSLFADCQAKLMVCVDDASGVRCEGCLPGAELDGAACVPTLDCGGALCDAGSYCDTSGSTPACAALPCPLGQAADKSGKCSACTSACTGGGRTGRVWPFRTLTGTCVCETLSGYFLAAGGSATPEACDADGDGWVREEAGDSAVAADPALAPNARCAIESVDGVLLRDEYGVDREVGSCVEGLVADPTPAKCASRVPLRLLETKRNDVPGKAIGRHAPAYGIGGRPLEARELNSLTKGCVDDVADYDDDGVEDVRETQTLPDQLVLAGDRERLASFAFFLETHRGWFQPPVAPAVHGKLVIAERSRCDGSFPLRYDPFVNPAAPTDGFAHGVGPVYWRSCYRRVDPAFVGAKGVPGFDFAQWSCDPSTTSCATVLAPAPASATADLSTSDPLRAPPRDASLCELNGAKPKDGRWRGMHHHSQFKCVRAAAVPVEPFDRAQSEFAFDGALTLNMCAAASCPAGDDSCSRPLPEGNGEFEPVIRCSAWDPNTPVSGAPKPVGFAAVRYRGYGAGADGYPRTSYAGGCVTEDTEWRAALCPYPQYVTTTQLQSFGRLSCGDDPAYLWFDGTTKWSTVILDDTQGSVLR